MSELERITKIKRPTIYLSIYRLQKKKLAKPDSRKRNKKWMLTENGRNIAMRRVRGEKLLEKVLPQLREALRRGIKLREVLRALTS
ncbi:MAG: hypothetical protein NZ920_03375 [Aigarchaeota archaeon]|nr:hypothetical protein [Aigarchaeota archaeon]